MEHKHCFQSYPEPLFYKTKGKNLLGQTVIAQMEKTVCDCGAESHKFIQNAS
jgi:hypothetical protein